MIDRDEMVGAIEVGVRAIVAGDPDVTLDVDNARPVADAIMQVLENTGWSLAYDPSVVANKLTQVVTQPMTHIDHGPLAPPEEFHG